MEAWTTRRLLAWTTTHFERHGLDSPRLAAEMLLAHVLDVPRLNLYMDADRPASDGERASFRALVQRASDHEPVDYLTGRAPFFSMTLDVTPAVLIPRPSTETLVEHVVQHARRTEGFAEPLVLEIGTGSGAIAIALARHVPGCRVVATDISPEALEVARANARSQGVDDRIEFVEGDLFEPFASDRRCRYLVSNPPYISDAQWADVAPNVRDHEPALALRAGADGLSMVRRIVAGAPARLDRPGQLVVEIADVQRDAALALVAEDDSLAPVGVLDDHEGLARVLVADTR